LLDLSWKGRGPERSKSLRRALLAHVFDDRRRREGPHPRESLADDPKAEPMVPVSMRDVNRRQVLARPGDPIGESVSLRDGHERIDEHCVPRAGDERRGHRRRRPLRLPRRNIVARHRYTWGNENVIREGLHR